MKTEQQKEWQEKAWRESLLPKFNALVEEARAAGLPIVARYYDGAAPVVVVGLTAEENDGEPVVRLYPSAEALRDGSGHVLAEIDAATAMRLLPFLVFHIQRALGMADLPDEDDE